TRPRIIGRVLGVELRDVLPRDADLLAGRDTARGIHLERVQERAVVDDDADRTAIAAVGKRPIPLGVGEALGKRREARGSLLDAFGQRFSAAAHGFLLLESAMRSASISKDLPGATPLAS